MITDIRFACKECGEYMIADSTAAGRTADCPHCGRTLIVPRRGEEPSLHGAVNGGEGKRGELQHRLEATIAECERIAAAGTLAQAELKSFQTERRSLKSELKETRQRLSLTEAQLAEHAEWLAGSNAIAEELEAERETLRNALGIAKERAAASDTQLSLREEEVMALRARIDELEAGNAIAQAEITALQEESALLRGDLDSARTALVDAGQTKTQLQQAQADLSTLRAKHEKSLESCEGLRRECEDLRQETATLRADLNETEGGRELVRLRSHASHLEREWNRLQVEQKQLGEDLQKSEGEGQALRELLKTTRNRLQDAERRADECSDERLRQDNMALRGIIARQNNELEARRIELHRFRRARLMVRLVYALVTLAIVALAIFGLDLLKSLEW